MLRSKVCRMALGIKNISIGCFWDDKSGNVSASSVHLLCKEYQMQDLKKGDGIEECDVILVLGG